MSNDDDPYVNEMVEVPTASGAVLFTKPTAPKHIVDFDCTVQLESAWTEVVASGNVRVLEARALAFPNAARSRCRRARGQTTTTVASGPRYRCSTTAPWHLTSTAAILLTSLVVLVSCIAAQPFRRPQSVYEIVKNNAATLRDRAAMQGT